MAASIPAVRGVPCRGAQSTLLPMRRLRQLRRRKLPFLLLPWLWCVVYAFKAFGRSTNLQSAGTVNQQRQAGRRAGWGAFAQERSGRTGIRAPLSARISGGLVRPILGKNHRPEPKGAYFVFWPATVAAPRGQAAAGSAQRLLELYDVLLAGGHRAQVEVRLACNMP